MRPTFNSAQALWGTRQLRSLNLTHLKPGTTYLFEMVYAANKIVIKYPFEGLILLAAYDINGDELSYSQLSELAKNLGINIVQKFDVDTLEKILEKASNLDKNSEGFILRFARGFRLLKRAVAVEMFQQGYKHREIQEILGVSSGFISKWTRRYEQLGLSSLRLAYPGSVGYLEPEQRQATLIWLQTKNYWNLAELQGYIQEQYDVEFESKQSYYTLFEEAGISSKKTQKRNPKADPQLVQKKTGDYKLVRDTSR